MIGKAGEVRELRKMRQKQAGGYWGAEKGLSAQGGQQPAGALLKAS